MNFRDIELLSSYLDGRLKPSDVARLEARLSSDLNLQAALEDLRRTRAVLRRLPQRRAPRDFRLTPKMAGVRPPEPRAYPVFRLATALAAFLFVASVALNVFTPFAAQRLAAAPAPAYGFGGGGGGGGGAGGAGGPAGGSGQTFETVPPAATEAPLQQPFAALAPTATPEGTLSAEAAPTMAPQPQDTAPLPGAPTAEANKAAPQSRPSNAVPVSEQPVPLVWVIGLGALMIACAVAAWLLRLNNERRIRSQWNRK